MSDERYVTPAGIVITLSEVNAQGLMICDNDGMAVIEDELLTCDTCTASYCLYCWESWNWVCRGCGKIYAAMVVDVPQTK